MEWPQDITEKLDMALIFPPRVNKAGRIQYFLDRAAMCAAWRVQTRNMSLEEAYTSPYTPIGYLTGNRLDNSVFRLGIDGAHWGEAIRLLHSYVRLHAQSILQEFGPQATEYPDFL